MKKKKVVLILTIILIVFSIVWTLYQPKSIDAALKRVRYPFEVGEVIDMQEIEANTILVIYLNKENSHELQSAILRKKGLFYNVVDLNGSLQIETPTKLDSGELRTQVLVSWYDKSDKYVAIAVAYDEEVATVTYRDNNLNKIQLKEYSIFYGFGNGQHEVYKLYDKNGNELEHIKP